MSDTLEPTGRFCWTHYPEFAINFATLEEIKAASFVLEHLYPDSAKLLTIDHRRTPLTSSPVYLFRRWDKTRAMYLAKVDES